MKIDHLALYVNDLQKTKDFYMQYFGAQANDGYHNPTTGLRTYFLTFPEGGPRLEIMNRPSMVDGPKNPMQTGYIHLSFSLGSREAVDSLTQRLAEAGYAVLSGPRTTGDGYYESCVLDGEGNQIELVA